MLELGAIRKYKINLADYNSEQDLLTRAVLSDFSLFDLEVLEEILFSPLKTSVKKISRTLGCEEAQLDPILARLGSCALLERQGDALLVDKDRRKHFEFQIGRFEEDFKPDMLFFQGLLKQVPIHVLPIWYAIPRSSNNIFESIVEKYLLTPQIYQRYLMELNFNDPVLSGILQDVLHASDFKVSSSDLISKYNLTRKDFDKAMLQLEFHFLCFISYEREEDHWHEVVTPFHEWREYLLFQKETETSVISDDRDLFPLRGSEFSFVEDMSSLLALSRKKPIVFERGKDTSLAHQIGLDTDTPEALRFAQNYIAKLIEKLLLIKLADQIDGKLYALEAANDWLDLDLQKRALYLYRHPLNRLICDLPPSLCSERNLREAEKSIKRILKTGWVFFDEFLRGVMVPLNEDSIVMLRRSGKIWKYTLPHYTEEERSLIKAAVLEWLFECGITMPGTCEGRDCFCVTSFGRVFFED